MVMTLPTKSMRPWSAQESIMACETKSSPAIRIPSTPARNSASSEGNYHALPMACQRRRGRIQRASHRRSEGAHMASTDVVTLQDASFDQEVLKSDVPVLVDFWAVWCGPCKAIAPAVEDIARRYKGKLKVGKMDVDEHQQVPQNFGIRSIPTLLIFKGGKVVGTVVGADKGKLEEAVKKVTG